MASVLRCLVVAIGASLATAACSAATDAAPGGTLADARALGAELNEWWDEVADDTLGFDFVPVPMDRITDGTDGATCDGISPDPDGEDLDLNAFVDSACREGVLVAVDPAYLVGPPLHMEMVLAHEWGHVLQGQAPHLDAWEFDGLSIDTELQADCFAGAWAGGTLGPVGVEQAALRTAESGDEEGVAVDDPDAHGRPEQRRAAFHLGALGGPAACVGDSLLSVLPE